MCHTGFWVLDCERTTDLVDNQIQLLLRRDLPLGLEVWRSLSANFIAELKVNLLPARWARGATVKADTIQLLSDRGLRLGIDIYAKRPPDVQADLPEEPSFAPLSCTLKFGMLTPLIHLAFHPQIPQRFAPLRFS